MSPSPFASSSLRSQEAKPSPTKVEGEYAAPAVLAKRQLACKQTVATNSIPSPLVGEGRFSWRANGEPRETG